MMFSFLASAVAEAHDGTPGPVTGTPAATADSVSRALTITHGSDRPVSKGPDDYFTGSVSMDRLFQPNDPARAAGASVTFQPGARTAWHTHPLGQRLIVTDGTGRVQRWGGPVETIRQGDVVWIPAGVKHWHGATPDSAMTHIAIQEQLDGKAVTWMEKVSDAQYGGYYPK